MLSLNSRIVVFTTMLSLSVMSYITLPQADARNLRGFPFNRYPANPVFKGQSAQLAINNADAKDYAGDLQTAIEKGTNFAGHYAIADHLNRAMGGKDTAAIVDVKTGEVYLPTELRGYHDQRGAGYNPPRPNGGLHYQANSKLLVIVGLPGEDAGKKGVGRYYYEWEGNKLNFIKFVSSPYQSSSSK
jgi:hypothetical protein